MNVLGRLFLNFRRKNDEKTEREGFFLRCRRTYVLNKIHAKKYHNHSFTSLDGSLKNHNYVFFNKMDVNDEIYAYYNLSKIKKFFLPL